MTERRSLANHDPAAGAPRPGDAKQYRDVRRFTEELCSGLEVEDLVAQSMDDASPTKWHLAHTTWFFETFVLRRFSEHYRPHHPAYGYLFNSYYNAEGERQARPQRGVLTRPTVRDVEAYRHAVDAAIGDLFETIAEEQREGMLRLVELGLHHEQQHQELMLMDLKHLFSLNALSPAYRAPLPPPAGRSCSLDWISVPGGLHWIGHAGEGFAFDNEEPRHRVFLEDFEIADRLITNREYQDFIEDGGYQTPELWLDTGWSLIREQDWKHPLYWRSREGGFCEFTLAGERELPPDEPVSHVSLLEADAFARWAGARLTTEAEWEAACATLPVRGNFVESGRLHPDAAAQGEGLRQGFGDLWEWTQSSYGSYPGFRPSEGALGEYNGKFMCNQFVLRGGSCVTAQSHVRATYRNFFYAPDRWPFTGIRLARLGS